MLRRLRSHVRGNLVGYIALLIAVTGSGSYALGAGGGSNGQIDACYVTRGKHRGDVRILVSGKCRRNETAISWSRGGPAGSPGGAGPQGAPGAQGASGAQGERGPVGPADGPAGGDLTGNFPNPELKPGSIGADEVAPDALGGDDIDESTLTGLTASCPEGMIPAGADLCVDPDQRNARPSGVSWSTAIQGCRDAGFRLPSLAEALTLDELPDGGNEWWTGDRQDTATINTFFDAPPLALNTRSSASTVPDYVCVSAPVGG